MNSNPEQIRVRACLAAKQENKLLLVPHFDTDAGPLQWNLPGGNVEYCERLESAALREFTEETGLLAQITTLLDVSEVVLPEKPWHSVTVTYTGIVVGGELKAEHHPIYGHKEPRWFTWNEIRQQPYHPPEIVEKAFGI